MAYEIMHNIKRNVRVNIVHKWTPSRRYVYYVANGRNIRVVMRPMCAPSELVYKYRAHTYSVVRACAYLSCTHHVNSFRYRASCNLLLLQQQIMSTLINDLPRCITSHQYWDAAAKMPPCRTNKTAEPFAHRPPRAHDTTHILPTFSVCGPPAPSSEARPTTDHTRIPHTISITVTIADSP